jgi:MYXO-CTERM domain-containing protein
MQDVTAMMLGTDATHLTEVATIIEDGTQLVPALSMNAGSEDGGGTMTSSENKFLGVDLTAKKFVDYGTHPAGGSYDRHLYSQYLGQNPNNQGRNFAGALFVKNPFYAAGSPQFLLLNAVTGKDPSQLDPAIKTSSYLSIMPTLNPVAAPPPPAGMPNTGATGQTGTGGGVNSQPQPGDPPVANDPGSNGATAGNGSPATPGTFTNGCSMSGSAADMSGVFVLLLGFGLAVVVRRRRA